MNRAWYLGVTPDQVAPRAIVVGDPARVDLFAARLDDARVISQERGLRTVTGNYQGAPITVSAFGMGAPIAAVVVEELAGLGVQVLLRAGTAMAVGGAAGVALGTLAVALAAVRGESTSATYAPPMYPAVADLNLVGSVLAELQRRGTAYRVGTLASFDGFYTQMLAVDDARRVAVAARLDELRRLRVVAVDMETSAVLVVGALLGVRAGSLCLISVDGTTRNRLDERLRLAGERQLVEVALAAVAATPLEDV